MPPTPRGPCPCRSGLPYKKCCAPYHKGRPAPSPLALMRSRYAAYALGKAQYIIDTTDPRSELYERDLQAWRASTLKFSRGTRFVGLRILGDGVDESGEAGWVRFYAGLRQGATDASFAEHSLFRRDAESGRWLYSGAAPPESP